LRGAHGACTEISAEIGSLHERLTAAETELADAVRRVSDAKLAALAEQQASLSLPTAGAEGGAEAPLLMPCTSTGFTSPLDIVAAAEAIDALRAHGVEFYRLMGERQQAEAHHWLGLRYQSGDGGVSQDLGKAFEQFQTSAQAGSLDAQFSLACRYLNGEGTRKDLGEGLRLLRAAADAGHPDAMNALATRYFTGSGVAQDMAEAVRYFEQAAAAGQRVAAYNFATCYYNGDGVEADHALAARYYKQAAVSVQRTFSPTSCQHWQLGGKGDGGRAS
jgi:TPR repeat protein